MISIDLPAASLTLHAAEAAKIIAEGIRQKFEAHDAKTERLLPCELRFYDAIALDIASFIMLKPSALEREFAALYAANPVFAVLASGSLPRLSRHIRPSVLHLYERLWDVHKANEEQTCPCQFCKVSSRVKDVFNWQRFIARSKKAPRESMADRFVKRVGLKVCPYCGRNHVAPLADSSGAIYRPDLDHFFPQSIYPYFALCLYNLVPSCSGCNCRIKLGVDFLGEGYFHPYEDALPDQLFVLEGRGVTNVRRLDPGKASLRLHRGIDVKARKSAEFFHLPLAYEAHVEEACHYAESLRLFPDSHLKEVARLLKVDVRYLMLILDRPDERIGDGNKHRVLGMLKRDMRRMFGKG